MAPTRDQLPDPSTSRRALLAATGALAGCLSNEGPETASPLPDTETGETPSPRSSETADTAEGDMRVLETVTGEALADGLEWLAAGDGRTLSLRSGTYTIGPDERVDAEKRNAHFVGEGLSGATIDGNDAKLVFTDPSRGAFLFFDSPGLTLRNLQIDFDPLPFTQGTIDDFDAESGVITLTLEEGYLPLSHSLFEDLSWGSVQNPETGTYLRNTWADPPDFKQFADVTHLEGRRYELTIQDWTPHAGLTAGNRLVFNPRQGGGGFGIGRCDDVTVENVRIYAMSGWNEIYLSGSPTVRNLHVAPPEGSDRGIAAIGDGIHFNNCWDGPVAEDCEFENIEDDALVVDWGLLRIDEVSDDHTITIGRGAKPSVEPNDDLVGISETAERLGPMPAIDTVERADGRPQEIVFEEPISEVLSPGDHVANLATANQGYVIRNNTVRNSRARPIRVTSPDGAITGNTIDGCNGAGIQLHSIVNGTFPPKGYVEDVVVEDNTIDRAGLVGIANRKLAPRAIRCIAESGEGSVTGQPHRNVRVIGNEIDGTAMEAIEVSHTRGVQIEDTTITEPNQLAGKGYGIVMDSVNYAEISGTSVSGASDTLVQFCGVSESSNVTLSGNSLSIDGDEETPKVAER